MVRGPHSVGDVLARIREHVATMPEEEIATLDAAGRVLARAAPAAIDLPPFASSAMDGWAVRAGETPGSLRIAGESAAGAPATDTMEAGTTTAISTGAVVPSDADAVVPIEAAVAGATYVEFESAVRPGANVRARGGDVAVGETVLDAGMRITQPRLAALLAACVGAVWCAAQPRVSVVTTGSELRAPGEPLGPGEITETNGALIAGSVIAEGGKVTLDGPVADDEQQLRHALERSLDADLLVTSGGVSVGRHDLIRSVLAELGAREILWGVAIRPGKPLWLAEHDATLIIGLPGNPVSALVGIELFVRPAIRMLQGIDDPGPHFGLARARAPIASDSSRDVLARARIVEGVSGPWVEILAGQESHMIARAAAADALVYVERGGAPVAAGSLVPFLRLA